MSAKIKRPWGGYIQCLFIIFCGLCCHSVVMFCNFAQGQTYGHDELSRNIWGFAALAIDFVGVCVFSMWSGKLARAGFSLQALFVNFVVLCCGAYSLVMFDGYGAVTRIEPAHEAELQHSADMTAHGQSMQASADARVEVMGIVQDELHKSVEAGLKRGANADQRSAAGIQSQGFLERLKGFASVEVKAPPVAKDTDPQATRVALHTGWKKDTAQEILSLALGGLLLLLSSLAVRHGVRHWPKRGVPESAKQDGMSQRYRQPYRPPQPVKPILTLVSSKGLSKRLKTVLTALESAPYPVNNKELARQLGVSEAEASQRVTELGSRVSRIRCGREVQISLASDISSKPPRKFSTYFGGKIGNKVCNESAVKPSQAAPLQMRA